MSGKNCQQPCKAQHVCLHPCISTHPFYPQVLKPIKGSIHARKQHRATLQAASKDLDTSAVQQLDRRALLLGLVAGSQLLGLPQISQAVASGAPDISKVLLG